MTAFGFLLIVLTIALGKISDEFRTPDWVDTVAAISFFGGGALMAAGFTAWLWRVMP